MDLYTLAYHTRSLRIRMAEARGDWDTVDRLRARGNAIRPQEEFTPFRLNVVPGSTLIDAPGHRVTTRRSGYRDRSRFVPAWLQSAACWFQRLRGVPAECG